MDRITYSRGASKASPPACDDINIYTPFLISRVFGLAQAHPELLCVFALGTVYSYYIFPGSGFVDSA